MSTFTKSQFSCHFCIHCTAVNKQQTVCWISTQIGAPLFQKKTRCSHWYELFPIVLCDVFYIKYWWLKYRAVILQARDDAVYYNVIGYCSIGPQRLHTLFRLPIRTSDLDLSLIKPLQCYSPKTVIWWFKPSRSLKVKSKSNVRFYIRPPLNRNIVHLIVFQTTWWYQL